MTFHKNIFVVFVFLPSLFVKSFLPCASAGRTAQETGGFVNGRTPSLNSQDSSKQPKLETVRLKVNGHLRKDKKDDRPGQNFFLDVRVQNESQESVKNLKVECEVYYCQKEKQTGKNGFDNVTKVYKHYPDKIIYQKEWMIKELKKFLDSEHFQTSQIWFNHDDLMFYSGYKVDVYNENGRLLAEDKD